MSLEAGVVLLPFLNLEKERLVLIQSGRTYLVIDQNKLQMECKHDEEFLLSSTLTREVAAYVCSCGCGFELPFDPRKVNRDGSYNGVTYTDQSKFKKKLPKIDYKAGEH